MGQFLKEKNVKRDMSWKLSVLRKEKLQPFSSLGLYPGGGGEGGWYSIYPWLWEVRLGPSYPDPVKDKNR